MKKTVMLIMLLAFYACIQAWTFTNLHWMASQRGDDFGMRNWLPGNADTLEKKYGIRIYIYKSLKATNAGTDPKQAAQDYYDTLTVTADDKILLIWVSAKRTEDFIIASDPVKKMVSQEYLDILQDDVLRSLFGRWYISDQRVLSKILGAMIYIIEKPNLTEEQIEQQKDRMIKVDDTFYNISLKPPFYDLMQLFYFEPMSFCFYFPFLMYALIVRLPCMNMNAGRKTHFLLNAAWAVVTTFVFALILNRIEILYPEYVSMFTVFMGFNIPVYLFLYFVYRDRIESAVYNYVYEITGGFGEGSTFKGMGKL